jgi:hypothetical protein
VSVDLYAVLGEPFTPDWHPDPQARTGDDDRPSPNTVYTASVETIDNDYVGSLLHAVSV